MTRFMHTRSESLIPGRTDYNFDEITIIRHPVSLRLTTWIESAPRVATDEEPPATAPLTNASGKWMTPSVGCDRR